MSMSTYEKVIFLHFKKQMTFREIADIIPDELRAYRELTYRGHSQLYPPIVAVQKIVGNEIAAHYKMGKYNKFVAENKINRYHNEKIPTLPRKAS